MLKCEPIYASDLDGTLAEYHGWADGIGKPIPAMVNRVKRWLSEGKKVAIFTARVALEDGFTQEQIDHQHQLVEAWCLQHIGQKLPVSALKSRHYVQMWDDRGVAVEQNTGRKLGGGPEQSHPFPNGVPK